KTAAEQVGVFPNPYYGFNPSETSRFSKFVTFNYLPRKATIRIFNLAGQLVRTMEKDDDSQFFRWNLLNTYNFPVASGMYVAHVDMPDLGLAKTLKMAIIQEQEVLDVY
ncbi:MAG: T9SS type A sorting domain-containing protein, partial [Ignavibacteriales bacterium]|nr:T9SS type A sorting domain-containing protein [Ignavibacteriales bacterium]